MSEMAPNVEIKRGELAKLGSKSFNKALAPLNIQACFKRARIWTLNPDALNEDMQPSNTFQINDGEDASIMQNILSLSGIDVSSKDVAKNIVENSQTAPNSQIISDQPLNNMLDNHNENMEDSLSFPSE